MAQDSKIEWTKHTANLWHGCTKVHSGCDNCYAETLSKRWGNDVWGNDKPRKEIKSFWNDLDKYQKLASEAGEKHTVFIGSMMDIFEKSMPMINSKGEQVMEMAFGQPVRPVFTDQLRHSLFIFISEGRFPNLIFLFLTKRPSNINKMIPHEWLDNPPSNVWFGTSPVNQETADNLIPRLLQVQGNKFLSIEPQLDHITIRYDWVNHYPTREVKIGWIINGGESGHHRRPFDLNWARSLRDQCDAASIPFFFKQIDKVRDKSEGIPEDLQIRQFPKKFKL